MQKPASQVRLYVALATLVLVGIAMGCGETNNPVRPSQLSASETGAAAITSVPFAQSVPGSYVLSFVDTSRQPVSQLPVDDGELVLKGHVEDSSGVPARAGLATFEYCSYKGLPPQDITRADEAPLEACETGDATWKRLGTVAVGELTAGDAYLDFGVVHIPRTVGFRFRYTGQGSGIAKGTSAPENFTWVSAL